MNLFTNDNRDVLSLVAYTGELVDTSQQSLLSTSWGTGGSFAKAWRARADGRLVLYTALSSPKRQHQAFGFQQQPCS